MDYKLPLILTPQPEGGYTVTSPLLPELVTEGDTVADALENVGDAFAAVVELYEDFGRTLPRSLRLPTAGEPFGLEIVVTASPPPPTEPAAISRPLGVETSTSAS